MKTLEKVWEILDFNHLPLPAQMEFEVSKKHIKAGEAGCPQGCPIAHAVSEHLQIPIVLVWIGSMGLTISNNTMATGAAYTCDDGGQMDFTWEFDAGRKVVPIRLKHVLVDYQAKDPIWIKSEFSKNYE